MSDVDMLAALYWQKRAIGRAGKKTMHGVRAGQTGGKQEFADRTPRDQKMIRRWCPWRESNPHSLRNTILSRARLPVPPHGLKRMIRKSGDRPARSCAKKYPL